MRSSRRSRWAPLATRLVLGKHSGRNALRVRYEKLGFTFERAQLDDIYRRFVALADKIKTIEDGHLLELVRDVPSRTSTIRR